MIYRTFRLFLSEQERLVYNSYHPDLRFAVSCALRLVDVIPSSRLQILAYNVSRPYDTVWLDIKRLKDDPCSVVVPDLPYGFSFCRED